MTCILGCKYILVLNILISHLRKFINLRTELLGKRGSLRALCGDAAVMSTLPYAAVRISRVH